MTLVKVVPKSKRAENRVREHGEVMELLMTDNPHMGKGSFLVRSLNDTFTLVKTKGKWVGWFTQHDASYELTNELKGDRIE